MNIKTITARLFATWLLITCAMVGGCTQKITIAHGGKSTAAIYVDKDVMLPLVEQTRWDKQTQSQRGRRNIQAAVNDLQTYLQRVTGATIPVLTRQPQPDDGHYPILIGEYAAEVYGPPAKLSKTGQAWRLVVSQQGGGMIGETDEAVTYAIYEFLHRLGCRWFMPGALGEVVPHRQTLALMPTDVSGIPSTVSRNMSGINVVNPDAIDYFRRNRLGGGWPSGAHALNLYITKKQLEANPDWIAQWDGKREMMRTTRNCWGNPQVAQAIADEIIRRLDKQYVPTVSLAPSDGMVFCQCDKCTALDAGDWDATAGRISITDRLINFCNRIIAPVNEKYPDVMFSTLAYVHYTRPPIREVLHPNLVVTLAPITYCRNHSMGNIHCPSKRDLLKIMQGWAKVTDNILLYQYAFNLAEVSAPTPMISKWSTDLSLFYDAFKETNIHWRPEAMGSFESVMPGLNLGVRLAFDSSLSPDAVVTDFLDTCYGPASAPMRGYWETLDAAWGSTDEHTGCGFGYHLRFTPQVLSKARGFLDEALDVSTGEAVRKRLVLADESFREFELFMKLRRNFLAGDFKDLDRMSIAWMENWTRLNRTYGSNFAFSNNGLRYFKGMFYPAYQGASEIAASHNIITKTPLCQWQYRLPGDDSPWLTTDVCKDTWSSLGLHEHFGVVAYRTEVQLPELSKDKKVYLWVGSTDGSCEVVVNGKAVAYINEAGESLPSFTGFCKPASFDITSALNAEGLNQIAITCERTFVNEIGTGGLMGPVVIYQQR